MKLHLKNILILVDFIDSLLIAAPVGFLFKNEKKFSNIE